MKKLSLLSFAFVAAILFSCSEAPNNGNYVDTTGTLLVTAKDANSGNLITNVEATFVGADKLGKTRKANNNGVVSIEEIPVGDSYFVKVAAPGYAPMICDFYIDASLNQDANIFATENAAITAELVKIGAGVQGYVDYQNPKTNALDFSPANANVQLVLNGSTNCEFEQKVFEITATDGKFEFINVPERTNYSLNYLDFTAEDVVLRGFNRAGLSSNFAGSTDIVAAQTYTTRNEFDLKMLECNGTVREAGAVKIVFNKEIKNSTDTRIFYVESWFGTPITTDVSGNTLTVAPDNYTWTDGDDIDFTVCSDDNGIDCYTSYCSVNVEN